MATPRVLTLQDVFAQLDQQSADAPFDPNVVINQFVGDDEGLIFTSETFTATTTTNYPVNLIQDASPVLYWRLDDPLSSTTVFDSQPAAASSYPKQPGTVHGTVTFQVTGAMTGSKAATFNGSNGYVEAANQTALQIVGDLTIECWLNTASLAATQTIVSKGATGEYHVLLNTNGSVTFDFGAAYSTVVVPASSITTGTWYHLAIVRATNPTKTVTAYLNGSSVFSGSWSTAATATTNVVRVGTTSPTAANYFNGTLDEVTIYQYPLSSTSVANRWAWAHATDCGSTPYGTGTYGRATSPVPGPYTSSAYGGTGITWGTFVWG